MNAIEMEPNLKHVLLALGVQLLFVEAQPGPFLLRCFAPSYPTAAAAC